MDTLYCEINPNDKVQGCENFYWYEFLYLKQLDIVVAPPLDVKEELIKTANALQIIRDYFEAPINITSGYRPEIYNKHIGGAPRSQHKLGKAVDFKIKGVNSDKARKIIKPMLNALGIRMENLPKSSWVHIDTKQVKGAKYFRP